MGLQKLNIDSFKFFKKIVSAAEPEAGNSVNLRKITKNYKVKFLKLCNFT